MKRRQIWFFILVILTGFVFVFGTAEAGGQRLVTRIKPLARELIQPRRGGAYISGITEYGSTCVNYTYTVHNGTDTGVTQYEYFMTILDDPREGAYAITMYDSGIISSSELTYTFYETGEYVLFVYRFDSMGNIVENQINEELTVDCLQLYIQITDDKENNPLITAVNSAAEICNKGNDFDTAVAINDYLVNHVLYDESYTYYSPEAALLGATGCCVCNGYSRAYQLIASKCGLDCRKVYGVAGGDDHAWDAVKINGNWYQVDPTWNDAEDEPAMMHVYMGLSDAVLSIDHSQFDYPDGTVVCDTLEDNYFIHTGKWTNLAGNTVTDIQTILNAARRNPVTVTEDFALPARLEGDSGACVADAAILQINGHIVAWALNQRLWNIEVGYNEVPVNGVFEYFYSAGNSMLTGELAVDVDAMTILEMPEDLDRIEAGAFEGTDAQAVLVPESCAYIGAGAFANCPNLVYAEWFEETELEEDAFGENVIRKSRKVEK